MNIDQYNSVIGPAIHRRHQLIVEILEARDLTNTGSPEEGRNVFCECYLKQPG